MRQELVVRTTGEELWKVLAERWRQIAFEAVREKGYCTAALPGGTTPVGFYLRLAREPGLPWHETHLFQVDERLVPHERPESNYRLVRESLLKELAVAPGSFHAIPVGRKSPPDATCDYEEDLFSFFTPREEGMPAFDLVLLGIGPDGHTASLFPGAAALAEKERLVVYVPPSVAGTPRVTMTFPLINNARNVIFLALGSEKSEILARVLGGKASDLPASRIRPREGKLFFFADSAAGPASRI